MRSSSVIETLVSITTIKYVNHFSHLTSKLVDSSALIKMVEIGHWSAIHSVTSILGTIIPFTTQSVWFGPVIFVGHQPKISLLNLICCSLKFLNLAMLKKCLERWPQTMALLTSSSRKLSRKSIFSQREESNLYNRYSRSLWMLIVWITKSLVWFLRT